MLSRKDSESPDTLTGRVRVSRVGTEALAPTAEVTVTVTKTDGTTVSKSTSVGFYERNAEVGDYVYADGSYSAELDLTRTPIALCFFVNPENKTERLCMALRLIQSVCWGLNGWGTLKNMKLQDRPTYSIFDVPTLVNKANSFSNLNINATTYRDESGTGTIDGYKVFASTHPASEIGFVTLDKALGAYEVGTRLPYGMVNTLKLIEHRNIILNDSAMDLPIPHSYTELEQAIAEIVAENNSAYKELYYPAASLCSLWEPAVNKNTPLNEKFTAGHLFLPSAGELCRILWHNSQGSFSEAKSSGLISIPSSSHCSTEANQGDILYGESTALKTANTTNKSSLKACIPVTIF